MLVRLSCSSIRVAPCKVSLSAVMETHNDPQIEMRHVSTRQNNPPVTWHFSTGCRWSRSGSWCGRIRARPASLYTLWRPEPMKSLSAEALISCFSESARLWLHRGLYTRSYWVLSGTVSTLSAGSKPPVTVQNYSLASEKTLGKQDTVVTIYYTSDFTFEHFVSYSHHIQSLLRIH